MLLLTAHTKKHIIEMDLDFSLRVFLSAHDKNEKELLYGT